jgi:hypothetical protein
MVIALILALAVATAPAKPAPPPAPPRTGSPSVPVHSESFKRGDKDHSFRVDYTASLAWTLADRKACFVGRCHPVCDVTIRHKILSRQLWLVPAGAAPILAENSPAEREYPGGVVTLGGACKAVTDLQVTRVATERLRPYQFAEELIRERPLLFKAADDYLALHPAAP